MTTLPHPSASGGLPAGMRERVLAASWQARPAGRPEPEPAEISPAEAFRRAADALDGLLATLGDDDWLVPVLRDLDVQGLVGHLIGAGHWHEAHKLVRRAMARGLMVSVAVAVPLAAFWPALTETVNGKVPGVV